jgi:hypothetical protein
VTTTAKESGFCFPVAVTATLWGRYVRVPDGVEGQDEAGRLWDILQLLRYAIRQRRNHADTVLFTVSVRNDQRQPHSVKLKTVCGPDDAGAPCYTLMLPGGRLIDPNRDEITTRTRQSTRGTPTHRSLTVSRWPAFSDARSSNRPPVLDQEREARRI